MQTHEYIAVPAPRKAVPAKGVKGVPAKFANAMTQLMNEMAAQGWRYQRTDTLPCEERQGLTGKTVKYHALLVFNRPVTESESESEEPQLSLPSPTPEEIHVEPTVRETPETDVRSVFKDTDDALPETDKPD